ncbi:YncE family protein [Novosphingobium sp. G106]|uniref:YncE family protein n=1 Tax=Novosphingobium sp. G106 TaxID=2849500 RepID=UPI001C2CC673|nr:YncE family protein [Novosphingobium sp. G106]MBV1691592.1 YncE family protein [Novosphingobium sp. G106]
MLTRNLVTAVLAVCLVAPGVGAAKGSASIGAVSYSVVDRIPAADGGWDFAAVDADSGKLYVARSNAITAVDLASRNVTDHLADAHRGHQVLSIEGGKTLFETDGETGLGRFISATDGSVLAEVATGTKPDAAFLDPKTGLIAVMNAGDGTVALLDPAKRSLAGKIDVGGGLEFAVADGKGGAFINIEDANTIVHVDLVGRRKTGTIALPGCEGPTGLALVANGTRLISACANEVALVIDTATGKTLETLAIGRDPDAVLVDEARGLAFIPCGGSGTLIALAIGDADHIHVAQTIQTQVGAKTGAIDPRNGRIYLPTATLAPPEPGAKRGKPVPGSFVVLVVAPTA